MKLAPADITIDDIDHEMDRRRPGLRFSRIIEPEFVKSYLAERAPMVPLWASLGTIFYCLAYMGDQSMLAEHADLLFAYRFGIFVPYAIAVIVLMQLWPSARLYEYLTIGVGVLGTALPMSVLAIADSPYAYSYQTGTVSTLLFVVVLLRPRFYASAIAVVLMVGIQFYTTHLNGGFDSVTYSGIVVFYTTFSAFLLLVAHSFEQSERRSFLHRLRNELLTERLRFQSEHDDLSMLRNRRSLTTLIDGLWASSPDRAVAAIMLDIDHFKLYNDVHGHISGDNCIRLVSTIFAQKVGDAGTCFRYGGEELLAILPDASLEDAVATADAIRIAIAAVALPHQGLEGKPNPIVTASLGAASMRTAKTLPGQLLAEADAALYAAKRKGRNRVHPAPASRAREETGT